MAKTNFKGVYIDSNGQYFIEVSLGTDKITGKRRKFKSRTLPNGKKFESAKEAHIEVTRIQNDYNQNTKQVDSSKSYKAFMEDDFKRHYESEVKENTFESREPMLNLLIERFGKKALKDITVQDAQYFRTWLRSKNSNYSQSYASLIFGTFKRTLEYAVSMQYLNTNVANKCKAIPKGKTYVEYWTKKEFELAISKIYIDDFYEHLCFIMIWVYYMTGVRVNEGTALWWRDIDFEKKQLRVNHMLILKSKKNWNRQNYTKTQSGIRTISLDDETIEILKVWKKRQNKHLGNQNFIFSYDSYPMIKSTINRIVKRYAQLANVPTIQPKGLRHSNVSYLINELNVNILVLSKRLGHSSPEITLKHYAHLWPGGDEELALQMSGQVSIKHAQQKAFYFNGNQAVNTNVANSVANQKKKANKD